MRRRRETEGRRRKRIEGGDGGGLVDDDGSGKKRKRGLLESDSEDDDEALVDGDGDKGDALLLRTHDPDRTTARDEFEHVCAVGAAHRIRGFAFSSFASSKGGDKKRGGGEVLRIAVSLITNAVEIHRVERSREG